MSTPARLKIALKSLGTAVDHLEVACERRLQAESERNDIEEEFAVLQDDRARLAVELDGAVARSQSLELANHEVARRLARARLAIKEMISHVAV
jgi:Domain of unknown function (DUF4164)